MDGEVEVYDDGAKAEENARVIPRAAYMIFGIPRSRQPGYWRLLGGE